MTSMLPSVTMTSMLQNLPAKLPMYPRRHASLKANNNKVRYWSL